MTLLRIWHTLTYLGDGAVLIPCATLIFVWLITAPATRRTGWWWLVAVLLVSGGVALSKVLYMVSGWHPAGWNFIGLSGHAALSFLLWPSAGALVTGRHRAGLRVIVVALGAGLALAISVSSWVSYDHSPPEAVLGALWGAAVATVFLTLTWRHVTEAPRVRNGMIASLLLLVIIAFGHELPSTRILRWIVLQTNGHMVIHTRRDLGPQARLSKERTIRPHTSSSAAAPHTPQKIP